MFIKTVVVGELETNCYIVGDRNSLAVIDPGADARKIINAIKGTGTFLTGPEGIKETASVIILTHAHPDHTGAVAEVCGELKGFIYMHTLDSEWLKEIFGSKFPGMRNVEDGGILKIGEISFCVWHTPGHTEGSICLYNEKEKILFSGDTLFAEGVGRTDLQGGDEKKLVHSLKRILSLPDEIRIYPGHGEPTTLGKEREFLNGYLKTSG